MRVAERISVSFVGLMDLCALAAKVEKPGPWPVGCGCAADAGVKPQ
jgi:hypothetical protein